MTLREFLSTINMHVVSEERALIDFTHTNLDYELEIKQMSNLDELDNEITRIVVSPECNAIAIEINGGI